MDSFLRDVKSLRAKAPKEGKNTPFWTTEPPTFNESGSILTGGMWPGQKTWWTLPNKVKLLLGGYGAGKTMSASKRAIASALLNAPCPVAVVSPTYSMAVDTMIATIRDLLEGKRTLYPGLRFAYNNNRHRFTIWLGGRKATIIIYSGDNPVRLKGPNLAAAYIDEPFIQDYDVFTQMLARIRHPEAKLREIGLTGTPEGSMGWGRDLVEGDLAEKYDVGYVRVSTRQNMALDPDYVETLTRAYDAKTAQAYIEGHFVNLSEGRMYYSFGDHNEVSMEMPDNAQLGVGIDFNVAPMTAAVFWHTPDHMHFIHEYELANSDTETLCQRMAEDFWEEGLRETYPDPAGRQRSTSAVAGRSDFDVIRRMGFNINARTVHTPRRDRFNAVNGGLRDRDGVGPRITFEPFDKATGKGCQQIPRYMMELTHENCTKRGKNGGERMTHLSDAASYGIDYLMPVGRAQFANKPLKGY